MSRWGFMQRPGAVQAWALYNFGGALRGTYRTRAQAKSAAEDSSGEPWAECRAYFQIVKVIVTPKAKP